MSLDERYFVTADLEEYFVDKDSGLPLAGGTLTFYRDVARTTPKTVFQLSGAPPNYTYTALPDPVTLSSVGTVQNAGGDNEVIYYFPYDDEGNLDLYYVVCRDSNGVEQFTREAWPNLTAADNPINSDFPIQNQLSNAQFTKVFINENQSTVYTVSAATNQVFAFAPNWDFVISGTGTVTIQRIAIAGNDNVATSPPYVLDVTLSGGITDCKLRQRLNVNSGLWASTADEPIFLAGTLIARNEGVGTTGIQMFYVESSGGLPVTIVDAAFDNAGYQLLTGVTAAAVPASTNTDLGTEGYVDIYLSFNPSSHVRVSSIQVIPTLDEAGGNFLKYDLNSSNREQAFMGDYYIPRLNIRPSASLLTAWDFPLNPFQFAASGNISATAAYICDQTIALRGASGAVAYARDAVTNGLQLTTAGTNDAFYIMQYLSGANAKKILGTRLSSNVFAYRKSVSDDVTMRVYLFRAPSGSSIPTLPTSIGTVATSGVFTVAAAGWTEIPRSGLDTATAVLPYAATDADINDTTNDMSFTGWELTDGTQIGDTDKFAIVVTFAYADASTVITVNSISLIPSDVAARPAPKSSEEVVSEYQYYYEKSYNINVYPGTATVLGTIACRQQPATTGVSNDAFPRFLSVRYVTRKRIAATPILYSTLGTINSVTALVYQGAPPAVINSDAAVAGNWTLNDNGETGFNFEPVNRTVAITAPVGGVPTVNSTEAIALFHFVTDSRLGIV
jgi:hypothetical protein